MQHRALTRRGALVSVAALGGLAAAAAPAAAGPINTTGSTSGLWGGTQIYVGPTGSCTAGFTAQNGLGRFMVTAGHCGNNGDTVRAVTVGGGAGGVVGTLAGKIDNGTFSTDSAAYYNGNARGYINASGFRQKVAGTINVLDPANAGRQYCFNGATSGYVCGGLGIQLGDQFCLSGARAIPGDSGAPVFVAGANAGEVLVAGVVSNSAVDGGGVCATRVGSILSAYGATIKTECQ